MAPPARQRIALRWGGTISFANRYLALERGKGGAVPEDGTLAGARFSSPVELDELLGAFTPAVRRDLRSFLVEGGQALRTSAQPLGATLDDARRPSARRQTSGDSSRPRGRTSTRWSGAVNRFCGQRGRQNPMSAR